MQNPVRHLLRKPVWLSRFRRDLRRLSLADRCLFFLFILLLIQSAVVLFTPSPASGGEIDIIIRTSSASIFGYLLGGGMSHSKAASAGSVPRLQPPVSREGLPPADYELQHIQDPPVPAGECSRIRVLTVAGAGFFCLCILLLLRDWPGKAAQLEGSDSAVAMIAQFRDFISGSLGFLTGCASRSTSPSSD